MSFDGKHNTAGPDGELAVPVSPSNTELTFQFLLGQRTVNISLTRHFTAQLIKAWETSKNPFLS